MRRYWNLHTFFTDYGKYKNWKYWSQFCPRCDEKVGFWFHVLRRVFPKTHMWKIYHQIGSVLGNFSLLNLSYYSLSKRVIQYTLHMYIHVKVFYDIRWNSFMIHRTWFPETIIRLLRNFDFWRPVGRTLVGSEIMKRFSLQLNYRHSKTAWRIYSVDSGFLLARAACITDSWNHNRTGSELCKLRSLQTIYFATR